MDWAALLQQGGPALLAILVPLAVAGVKKVYPSLPPMATPLVAVALGPLGEAGAAWLSGQKWTGVVGIAAGLAGIGLREIIDQSKPLVGIKKE